MQIASFYDTLSKQKEICSHKKVPAFYCLSIRCFQVNCSALRSLDRIHVHWNCGRVQIRHKTSRWAMLAEPRRPLATDQRLAKRHKCLDSDLIHVHVLAAV